jgi:hypothetical protein
VWSRDGSTVTNRLGRVLVRVCGGIMASVDLQGALLAPFTYVIGRHTPSIASLTLLLLIKPLLSMFAISSEFVAPELSHAIFREGKMVTGPRKERKREWKNGRVRREVRKNSTKRTAR